MRNQPQGAPERRIFVRGDRAIAYGRIMEVMAPSGRFGADWIATQAFVLAGLPTTRTFTLRLATASR